MADTAPVVTKWDKEGTLDKKGAVRKSWKTRTFRLQKQQLLYFAADKKKGAIDLGGATTNVQRVELEKHPFSFAIMTASRRWLLSGTLCYLLSLSPVLTCSSCCSAII
jgi:hypothetical protein